MFSVSEVSIHPDSKYQEALAKRIPIVKPSYLEAVWEHKRLADVQCLGEGVCLVNCVAACWELALAICNRDYKVTKHNQILFCISNAISKLSG